jgi:asparagine synthase (glutamine-hydrolysing)
MHEKYLISNQWQIKVVFRAAMRDNVPEAILDWKDTIGFATPEQEWIRVLPSMIKNGLDQPPIFRCSIIFRCLAHLIV